MKRVLLYASGIFIVVGALLQIQACGGSSGTAVSLKVGSIATAVSARRAAFPLDAEQSFTEFAFAKVDGIKLNLRSLQALKSGNNEQTIVTFSGGKEIIIAPGATNTKLKSTLS